MYRGAHHHVVEVDDVEEPVAQQEIAEMEIAMDAMDRNSLHRAIDRVGETVRGLQVADFEKRGDRLAFGQETEVFADEEVRRECEAMRCGVSRADVVDARDQPTEPRRGLARELIGRASTTAIREAVEDPLDLVKRLAAGKAAHRNDGNLLRRKLIQEEMFVENLRFAPAPWAIELCDHSRAVNQLHFIDAVFERVERITEARRTKARRLDGFEDFLGSEAEEEVVLDCAPRSRQSDNVGASMYYTKNCYNPLG